MFDFGSLSKSSSSELPSTLAELFRQLDRKTTHTSLRPAQIAALAALDVQLSERDIIMKLSTGSGKTVIGLVYSEMMRRKCKGEPVVYLCPTKQLVDQVISAGQAIGVAVSTFPAVGLPFEALSGETVLACTYDKLFTANSVFESKSIRPSTIVMDDVHAGAERVRKYFTVPVPPEFFNKLRKILHPLCADSDSATWDGIAKGDQGASYEVPYWVWSKVSGEVSRLLATAKDRPPLLFTWGNISRYIELGRCCISGVSAEIALHVPPVEDIPSYAGAKHRLFMSASIKDVSSLISSLACDPSAYPRLIEPLEDEGAGERMILPTSLIDPSVKGQDIAMACRLLALETNVVVLTSSVAQAKKWTDAGATLAQTNEVDGALEVLRTTNKNFYVFPQRFDGVDLPDQACRILVIDGIPSGDRIIDHVDAYRQKDSPEYVVRTINKFEQALGRAVRSSADYAAVILVGPDIASFIGQKKVASLFEERTRLQVDLGRDLAIKSGKDGKPISAVIAEMARALLLRNDGWREAYRSRVIVDHKQGRSETLTAYEDAALALRDAWNFAKAKNFQGAVTRLREASNVSLHPIQKAELLYWVSTYLHQFDPAQASDAYKSVFNANFKFPRPEKMVNRKYTRLTDQARSVCDIYSDFASANAALARIDEVKIKLAYESNAETVERGLFELGEMLGATSKRPEKETGRGPDVLWLFDDCSACIEAKNMKDTPIHKTEAGQLVLSMEWCDQQLAANTPKPVAVFATNINTADRPEDISFAPRLLTESFAMDVIDRLKSLVIGLSFEGPLFTDPTIISKKLLEHGINGNAIIGRLPIMKP